MESAGYLVAVGVELPAGVEFRHHDFGGGYLFLGMKVSRNATPVIDNGYRVVDVDGHRDVGTMSRQSLINRIIDDLIDEVMKAVLTCRPDIHRGAETDGLEALQDLDVTGVVGFLIACVCHTSPVDLVQVQN